MVRGFVALVIVVVTVIALDARRAAPDERWPALRAGQLAAPLQCLAVATSARIVATVHARGCYRLSDDTLDVSWDDDAGAHTFDNGRTASTATVPRTQARTIAMALAAAASLPPILEPPRSSSTVALWGEVSVTCDGVTTTMRLLRIDASFGDALAAVDHAAAYDLDALEPAVVLDTPGRLAHAFGHGNVIVDGSSASARMWQHRPLTTSAPEALAQLIERFDHASTPSTSGAFERFIPRLDP